MKFWTGLLKVVGFVWLALAGLVILVGILGTWMKGGFSAVQELMSPFNVVNYVFIIVTVAPGLGLLAWADRLKNKGEGPTEQSI